MILTTTSLTEWIIEVYGFDGVLVQNLTISMPNRTSNTMSSLNPGVIYMIRVAGVNTRGVGNFSDFATGQTYRGIERPVIL